MGAIFYIMREIIQTEVFIAWISTCIAVTLIYIIALDTLFALLFTFIFNISRNKQEGVNSLIITICSATLVGNADYRARLAVSLEIKGKSNNNN